MQSLHGAFTDTFIMGFTSFWLCYSVKDCRFEFRFRSRCLIVPFKNRPTGPKSPFERKLRAELEAAVMDLRYSSALGWIISLGEELRNDCTVVQQIEAALQGRPQTQLQAMLWMGTTAKQGWEMRVYNMRHNGGNLFCLLYRSLKLPTEKTQRSL